MKYTIAVDFDGVIHSYTSSWKGAGYIPDAPVPGAIEWLNKMQEKFDIVIFTTRGKWFWNRWKIKAWLWDNGYTEQGAETWTDLKIKVTATKPPALIYIDDRAWRFNGVFPGPQTVHRMIPWNKPNKYGNINRVPTSIGE